MTRFEKFYEWLCDAVCPIMIVGFAIAACVIVKVCVGFAGTDIDAVIMLSSIAVCYIAFITWAVCSIIKARMLKSDKGGQA